jgi:hypothetical protein
MRRPSLLLTPLALLALTCAPSAAAQRREPRTYEIRALVGASVPTGAQRDVVRDALLAGGQLAVQLRTLLHVTGSFAWMPTTSRYDVDDPSLDVLQADLGVELGLARWLTTDWEVRPYVAAGAGARTYVFASDSLDSRACAVGFGSLGVEWKLAVTAMRLEAKDNVVCYRSPVPGDR